MSGNTTAIERSLEVLNNIWDAMHKSGEVPTYAERVYYYLALKEAIDENAKLREYAAKAWSLFVRHGAVHPCDLSEVDAVRDGMRELGIEVD